MEGPDSPGFLIYLNTTRNELKKKLVFDDVGDATLIVNLREMWSELSDGVKRSYEKYAAASKRKVPGQNLDPAFLLWYFTYWQDEKRKYPNLKENDGSSIRKAKEVWNDEMQTSYELKEFFEKLAAASGQGIKGKPIVQKERKVVQKRRWL